MSLALMRNSMLMGFGSCSSYAHILHQSVARGAHHTLVRVSAARCVAETRQIRKVQDLSMLLDQG
jgi:hypothetical protein